jgi:hypothetical protein
LGENASRALGLSCEHGLGWADLLGGKYFGADQDMDMKLTGQMVVACKMKYTRLISVEYVHHYYRMER